MQNQKPISVFWACFFSMGIFALLWTEKMKKTRKWIAVILFTILVEMLIVLLSLSNETMYDEGDTGIDLLFILIFIPITVHIILPVYYMYKWTSNYNLENFDHESSKDWKKPQADNDDEISSESSI